MALIIGVVTIISMVSVTAGIRSMVTDAISGMNGIMVWEKDALDQPWSYLSTDYEQKLESISGVRVALPEVFGFITEIDGDTARGSEMMMGMTGVMGIDPVKEQEREGTFYGMEMDKGRWLKPGDKSVVILGNEIADNYKKRIGSTIELDGKKLKVIGILKESQMFGGYMLAPIDVARELADLDSDIVNDYTIQAYNPQDQGKIAKIIEFKYDDLQAMNSQSAGEEMSDLLNTFDMVFLVISLIALLTAGVVIINTMLMSVMDRQKEIGVLKAVGWTNDDILKLVLIESLLLGIIGGIIGCIIGSVIVTIINSAIPFSLTLTPTNILGAFIFAVSAGLFGGLYPAWRISRINPIDAIRME
ncbi:ABC transporter permease [archaeon]|nr:ABC transporter permease [archaeon]